MLRLGLMFIFTVSMVLPSLAKAGCSDCPFPMAKMFGSWHSDKQQNFTVIISEEFRSYEEIGVKVVIWDDVNHRAVAVGYGKGEPNDTSLRVNVRFENGKRQVYNISLDRLGRELIMDRGGNAFMEGTCNAKDGCFILRPAQKSRFERYNSKTPDNWI